MPDADFCHVLALIQAEFVEMPGLTLTLSQAGRLWALPPDVCRMAFTSLVSAGFLVERAEAGFGRRGPAAMPVGSLDPFTWTVGPAAA